ncbi:hypothetical protein QFZ27_001541 [Inquilinus ginsengisoli]|jgi:hypothetical protein|uniref:hypothetical protein n=1 Tax=Inquilinus ginsengisoli TaxID=363840 RepID=UPI003D1B0799
MIKLCSTLALVLALSCCAGQAPLTATPDPALAEKVHRALGNDICSGRVAGALAAHHLTAGSISRIELAPVTPGYPTEYSLALRQVWVRQPSQPGAIVVRYDPRGCRIAEVYGRDGATLPTL